MRHLTSSLRSLVFVFVILHQRSRFSKTTIHTSSTYTYIHTFISQSPSPRYSPTLFRNFPPLSPNTEIDSATPPGPNPPPATSETKALFAKCLSSTCLFVRSIRCFLLLKFSRIRRVHQRRSWLDLWRRLSSAFRRRGCRKRLRAGGTGVSRNSSFRRAGRFR